MTRRATATILATALTLGLAACGNDAEQPTPAPPPSTTTAEETVEPITSKQDQPTIDDATVDWSDPDSVSYAWLWITNSFITDGANPNHDGSRRGAPLTTRAFQKQLDAYTNPGTTLPWWSKDSIDGGGVTNVVATVDNMTPADRFHDTDARTIRTWEVTQDAADDDGTIITSRATTVTVTLEKQGEKWKVKASKASID